MVFPLLLRLFFCMVALYIPCYGSEHDHTIFLTIISTEHSHYLPKYLEHIEKLDYDKTLITLYIDMSCGTAASGAILSDWINSNRHTYKNIITIPPSDVVTSTSDARNKSLQAAKQSDADYYFVVDTHVFLAPYTLNELLLTNRGVIAPLLHIIPKDNDIASNYFVSATPQGYYKEDPNYLSILHRSLRGIFRVASIQYVNLIKKDYLSQLNYGDGHTPDYIAFGKSASDNEIDLYLANERPYGVFASFDSQAPLEEQKKSFDIIAPYINPRQEHEKKYIYIKTGHWGDIFDQNCPYYNKECWIHLRQAMLAAGYKLEQVDTFDTLHHFEKLLVLEIFGKQLYAIGKFPKEKLVLLLWEPPSVITHNYDRKLHAFFSKVLTWHDDYIDNVKYFKIHYPDLRPMSSPETAFDSRKLAVLVASNKSSTHKNELYSARKKVVDFYNRHHAEGFDLYGPGWPSSHVYKGKIEGTLLDKVEKLKSYKFCYAYENIHNEPGYITEKILNCFQAGTVPIYWGAPNITDYIPKSCYITATDFKNNAELYRYLKNMQEDEYNHYLENIRLFLSTPQAHKFSIENFVQTIMSVI